jgi:hypothetical protein
MFYFTSLITEVYRLRLEISAASVRHRIDILNQVTVEQTICGMAKQYFVWMCFLSHDNKEFQILLLLADVSCGRIDYYVPMADSFQVKI